jgi:SAM-dependent methyltransferase
MYKQRLVHPIHPSPRISSRLAAAVYNQAGNEYVNYADGDPERLFCFDGPHAYADRQLWSVIEKKLGALRAAGVSSITVLDAGCGPGTWLRRVVTHAHRLGFSKISARGFDVAVAQVQAARRLARDLAGVPGVCLTFEVADLLDRLSEPDASVDITLCLYSVLSHLPVLDLPKVVSEFARVTMGYFITTVRSIGSAPTALVDSIEGPNVQTRPSGITFNDRGRGLGLAHQVLRYALFRQLGSGHSCRISTHGSGRLTPVRRAAPLRL